MTIYDDGGSEGVGGGSVRNSSLLNIGPCERMARVLDAIDQALIEGAGGLSAFLNLGHDRLDEIVKAIDAAFSGHYLGHPANSSANIADLSTTFGRGDLPDRAASGPALGSASTGLLLLLLVTASLMTPKMRHLVGRHSRLGRH